jgi:SAM-dependent methyltransferase
MELVQKVAKKWKSEGLPGLVRAVRRRIVGNRLKCYRSLRPLFRDKKGLELGGPSWTFTKTGQFPVYQIAACIDNCNFFRKTIWEGEIREGASFRFNPSRPAGHQYILEATELTTIGSEAYDFVLSSHMLEHSANPIKALSEWLRVVRPGGTLLLVLPHRDGTFDHRRPITPLEHLIDDFRRDTSEADLTHLPEILELHDLAMDPPAGTPEQFKERSQKNLENRCLHHHVFDTALVVALIDHMGLQICAVEVTLPYNIYFVARKPARGQKPDNSPFLADDAEYHRQSPFPSDRVRGMATNQAGM